MITNKEQFTVKVTDNLEDFFENNPEGAKRFLEGHMEFIEFLPVNLQILGTLRTDKQFLTNLAKDSAHLKEFESKMASSKQAEVQEGSTDFSLGGNQLVKRNGNIPMMFNWDNNNNGFSNYLTLAGLAFSIQLIVTLICIFFYK